MDGAATGEYEKALLRRRPPGAPREGSGGRETLLNAFCALTLHSETAQSVRETLNVIEKDGDYLNAQQLKRLTGEAHEKVNEEKRYCNTANFKGCLLDVETEVHRGKPREYTLYAWTFMRGRARRIC
ncbi:hypothetical protein EVAR_88423_1 [Eumeta japonica]|uniref:Uncharacterized protein n=1 Tax=Eumeta variegata TaxID=151549 RepID=A0A4C1Y3W2_EUMVA|nr:hypothetical protein EVAR_88423_1 [Eumeta japonica]